MIEEGDQAPDFTAPDQDGTPVTLSQFQGKRVVLYFYPKDDTPDCTKEACNLRDNIAALHEKDVVVLGVSTDSVESHAAFKEKHELPFTLIADSEKEIIKQYGVNGRLGTAKRVTVLIGEDGVVEHVFRNVDAGNHADQILEVL